MGILTVLARGAEECTLGYWWSVPSGVVGGLWHGCCPGGWLRGGQEVLGHRNMLCEVNHDPDTPHPPHLSQKNTPNVSQSTSGRKKRPFPQHLSE